MRITNNMLVNNMINYISNNETRMSKYQQELATGKKVVMPSDDPVVAARALKLRTDVSQIEQYQTNVKDAQSWTDITESTLSDMGDVLQRVRELAVEGANGTNTQNETQNIADEVSQLKEQIIHLGNTTYAGRYIFSGFSTDKPLLNDDGTFAINVNTYTDPSTAHANREDIKYEIGVGDDISINVQGGDLFNNGHNASTTDTKGISVGSAIATFPTTGLSGNSLNIYLDGSTTPITVNFTAEYNNITNMVNGINSAIQTATGTTPATAPVVASAVNGALKFVSNTSVTGNASSVKVSVANPTAAAALGLSEPTQIDGSSQKSSMIQDFDDLLTALNAGDTNAVSGMITKMDNNIGDVLRIRSDIGARQNRLNLTSNRLGSSDTNFTKLMSDNEDVDMASTIMNLQNEENVYRASLAGGARIIQPSLVDFLK